MKMKRTCISIFCFIFLTQAVHLSDSIAENYQHCRWRIPMLHYVRFPGRQYKDILKAFSIQAGLTLSQSDVLG